MRPRRTKRQAWNSKDVELNEERCSELRKLAHELSNVTTGMLMAVGLLRQTLAGDVRGRYCEQIAEAGERTTSLVHEMRTLLYPEGELWAARSALE